MTLLFAGSFVSSSGDFDYQSGKDKPATLHECLIHSVDLSTFIIAMRREPNAWTLCTANSSKRGISPSISGHTLVIGPQALDD
ncbi:MAG: hypothetical protein AAGI92_04890 [Pseudomonadota bacterium]